MNGLIFQKGKNKKASFFIKAGCVKNDGESEDNPDTKKMCEDVSEDEDENPWSHLSDQFSFKRKRGESGFSILWLYYSKCMYSKPRLVLA